VNLKEKQESMTTSNPITGRDVETLRTAVTGDVFTPGEVGYDEARQAWNLTTDERLAVVVMAESATDVVQAVRFARFWGMRIAPQGSGHGSEPLEPLQDAMLLRAVRMRGVRIDPAARIARAEAGALWQDVTVPAGEHGVAALAGTSPNVGVTGYILGGGMGWLAPPLRAGRQQRDGGRDRDPGRPSSARRRRSRAGSVLGGPRGRRQRRGGDRAGDEAVPGPRAVRRGAVLPDPAHRGGAARLARVDRHGAGPSHDRRGRPEAATPLASIEVRHLGGALARLATGGGAQAKIDANHVMFSGGFTPTPELAATVRGHAQAVKDALAAWHAGYDYYNFEETPAAASAVLPPASYHRLQKIEASYDPDQAIISAHPVRPVRLLTGAPDAQPAARAFAQDAVLDLTLHTGVGGRSSNEKR
jgi:hypothetical protein